MKLGKYYLTAILICEKYSSSLYVPIKEINIKIIYETITFRFGKEKYKNN